VLRYRRAAFILDLRQPCLLLSVKSWRGLDLPKSKQRSYYSTHVQRAPGTFSTWPYARALPQLSWSWTGGWLGGLLNSLTLAFRVLRLSSRRDTRQVLCGWQLLQLQHQPWLQRKFLGVYFWQSTLRQRCAATCDNKDVHASLRISLQPTGV
jgi:hypothetical protein